MSSKESHTYFLEVFEQLNILSTSDKIKFFEALLFCFTITGRAIWSDDKATDTEKVEAFKWLNELCHRTWNIRCELQRNENNDSVNRLYENMKSYGGNSPLLMAHFIPAVLDAYDIYKNKTAATN
ncbi:MAG: hypothetical protein QM791_10265 [Ferruginibacter sp.]